MRDEIYSRELRWNELFTKAMYLFAQNFRGIFLVMLVLFLPVSLLESVILDRMTNLTQALQQFVSAVNASSAVVSVETYAQMMQIVKQVLLHEGLYFALLLFLQPVGIVAIAKLTKAQIDGHHLSLKTAMAEALNLEPTILVSGFFYGVLLFLGGMVIIPGIYLSVAWGLYLYCIGLGGRKGWDALRHSKELVRGKWWRTLGYLYLLSAMAALGNTALQSILLLGDGSVLLRIVYRFLCYFCTAFVTIGEALLFINREAMAGGMQLDGYHFEDGDAAQTEEDAED